MGFKKIREYVPAFYHRFLPSLFDEEIPDETFARCMNCPMAANSREEMNQEVSKPFAPDSKCCTYVPHLPNYFAGAFLQDEETEVARTLLKEKIKSKRGVFPHGLYPDKKYALLYEFGSKDGFGKSIKLKCPYYLQGEFNCSLWKYRESICANWFCKYIAGNIGRDFWNNMRDLFTLIQKKLLSYVLMTLELDISTPYGEDAQLTSEDIDSLPMKNTAYKKLWKHWEGKEEEFYLKSFEIINSLSNDDFNKIVGEEYQSILSKINELHNRITVLPEELITNPELKFEEVVPGHHRVRIQSLIDRNQTVINFAFDIPLPILESFKDRGRLDDILGKLSTVHNIELGRDILIALYHNGALIKEGDK